MGKTNYLTANQRLAFSESPTIPPTEDRGLWSYEIGTNTKIVMLYNYKNTNTDMYCSCNCEQHQATKLGGRGNLKRYIYILGDKMHLKVLPFFHDRV